MIPKFFSWFPEFRGRTHLTILVVPHGSNHSIHFEISLLSLGFKLALVFALLGSALSSYLRSEKTKGKLTRISAIHGIFYDYYQSKWEEAKDIQDHFSQIQENLLEIYSLLEGSDQELLKIPSIGEIDRLATNQLQEEAQQDSELLAQSGYLEGVLASRATKIRMEEHKRLLEANFSTVERLDDFFKTIPVRKPLAYFNLTSNFGTRRSPTTGYLENHEGLDLANAPGTPIRASAHGVVSKVVYSRVGYGYHLILEHKYGYSSLYGHCDRILVKPGQEVFAGEVIAEVGSTGNVTGPHLHYEIWRNDSQKTDPEEFLNAGFF